MSNKLTETAKELLMMEGDLPFRFDYTEEPKPSIDDFDMRVFPQVWGSTALGFGGVGGQAITAARTYVFIPVSCKQKCFVYFAGRFAYAVPYSDVLMNDIRDHDVESVNGAGKYFKAAKEEGRIE